MIERSALILEVCGVVSHFPYNFFWGRVVAVGFEWEQGVGV